MNETTGNTKAVKQLRRSRDNRMIAGVCAGWANYLNIDVTVARLGFVAATFLFCGLTIPVYFAAWLLTPEED